MKRLFYLAGLVLALSGLNSCAQHDSQSPDTSGNLPKTQPGVGIDTVNANETNNTNNVNAGNDNTNNNQTINTGDSSKKKQ